MITKDEIDALIEHEYLLQGLIDDYIIEDHKVVFFVKDDMVHEFFRRLDYPSEIMSALYFDHEVRGLIVIPIDTGKSRYTINITVNEEVRIKGARLN